MRSCGYRWNVIGLFTLVGLLVASCNLPASTSASVWLDVPTDGLTFPAVQEIKIEGHASGAGGVSRVEIWINGTMLTTIDDPPMEGELAAFHTAWAPAAEGRYAIQAIAFSLDGVASEPDSAVVTFGGETPTTVAGCPSPVGGGPTPVSCEPTVMVCPSPMGGGPTPVSCEPTVVFCPSPVGGGPTPVSCEPTVVICPSPAGGGPTPVSCEPTVVICPSPVGGGPTPASCPPGAIVEFWADPAEIEAGACTHIRWHAEGVDAVVFGGVSQPPDGSYEACLCDNERYTLKVTLPSRVVCRTTLDPKALQRKLREVHSELRDRMHEPGAGTGDREY